MGDEEYMISCDPALDEDKMSINVFIKKKQYVEHVVFNESSEVIRRRLIKENQEIRKNKIEKLWKLKS